MGYRLDRIKILIEMLRNQKKTLIMLLRILNKIIEGTGDEKRLSIEKQVFKRNFYSFKQLKNVCFNRNVKMNKETFPHL